MINLNSVNRIIYQRGLAYYKEGRVEDQATDRAHRIGQKKVVQVIKLISQGTIEEKIIELQAKKRGIVDSVIDSEETFISSLTEDDIRELFAV